MPKTNPFGLRRPGAAALLWLAVALSLTLATARPAAAAAPQFAIYGDELAPDWELLTSQASANTGSRTTSHAGQRSLAVTYRRGAAYVQLSTNFAVYTGSFTTLRFAIYGGGPQVGSIAVTLYDGLGQPGSGAVIVPVPVGHWSVVAIPLTELGAPPVIGGIRLTKVGELSSWSPYYLDEIALVGSDDALPTATPPPPTTEGTSPSPTATQPAPTVTQPAPTVTQPPPTATQLPPTATQPPAPVAGIWISPAEIAALPANGPGWQSVFSWAQESSSNPDLSDQNDQTDAVVVAKALVYVKTGDSGYREEVVAAIMAAMGTEDGGNALALARNLAGYVIAADLVGLSGAEDAAFRGWLSDVRHENLDGRTLISTHENRPNNWGTHAGASRIAAAIFLGDTADLQRAATVFRGWLGERAVYAGFKYGDLDWQANPAAPVGVNPAGATIQGHNVDGVLPDDQRRGGPFTWPPPGENYVWEALQGVVAQARMLNRQGFDAFNWSDQAILRAVSWLHEEAGFPASGDDSSTPWLINGVYGTGFPAPGNAKPGKNGLGWYQWFYGG